MPRLPFLLGGSDGAATISYGISADPAAWGFGCPGLPFDLDLVRGFPLVLATVDDAGRGYDALMGRVQVVTVEERDPPAAWAGTDIYPMHRGVGSPFVTFGHAPSFVDASGLNPPRANER